MLIDKAMELERMSIEEKYDEERLLELRREKVKPIIEEFYTFISSLSPGKGSHLYEAVNLLTTLPALGKNPSEESLIGLLPWSDSLPDYCKAQYSEIL